MTDVWILDERHVWWQAIIEAGARFGHQGKRIKRGHETRGHSGIGFIRPHADPRHLRYARADYVEMRQGLNMIQDDGQIWCYEDKSQQFFRWGHWMPDTWILTSLDEAMEFLATADYPIVSKADQGASSKNVRILKDRREAEKHARQIFGPGIQVDCCAGGAKVTQKGYVYLQRFIPHKVTWRVAAVGNGRSMYKRYNYPDRPVAQSGNADPVLKLDDETESLLQYADGIFTAIGTKWCGIDVLRDGDQWKLLETSCAWPWPDKTNSGDRPIFRTDYRWPQLFDAMFAEYERGAWA